MKVLLNKKYIILFSFMGRVSFTPLSLRSTVVHCDPPRSARYTRFAQILYYYISRRKRAKVKRSFGCGLLSVPFGSSYRKTWVSEWVTKNRVNGANDERGEGKKGRHSLPYITSGPVPSVFASQSHDGTGCREVMMIENLCPSFSQLHS